MKKRRKKPKHMILTLGCLKIDNDYIFWSSIIWLVSSSGIPRLIALLFSFSPHRNLPGRLWDCWKRPQAFFNILLAVRPKVCRVMQANFLSTVTYSLHLGQKDGKLKPSFPRNQGWDNGAFWQLQSLIKKHFFILQV